MRRSIPICLLICCSVAIGAAVTALAYDAVMMRPTKSGETANQITIMHGHMLDRLFGFRSVPLR